MEGVVENGVDTEGLTEANQISLEQEDAAMAAGFADARGAEVPTAVRELNTEVAEVPAVDEARSQEVAREPTELDNLRAQVAGLGEAVRRSFEQVHGKFGEHNRLIQEFIRGKNAPAGAAGAPARKVGADAFKKLAGDYPEIAAQMVEGLEQVLASQPAGGIGEAELDQRVNARVEERVRTALSAAQTVSDQKLARVHLSVLHPDWQATTKTREFESWFRSRPPAEQKRLFESWDAPAVSAAISEFKSARRNMAAASHNRNRRLAAAVTPIGTGSAGPSAVSDDDALQYGFRIAHGA
jgi:hypothetical protein